MGNDEEIRTSRRKTLEWASISVSICMFNPLLVNNIFKTLFTLYSKQTGRM